MFDARIRPQIDPLLNAIGRWLARKGISANAITFAGLVPALGGAVAIVHGYYLAALMLILANRLFDGLDGAVARASGISDLGGYFDTLADFAFYVAVPVAFGLASPANAIPALLLVASFTLTCASFLAFAVIAAKRGEETRRHGLKSFFYSTGIAEGTETIAVFTGMCLWPDRFPILAVGYALVCLLTVGQRSLLANKQFRGE